MTDELDKGEQRVEIGGVAGRLLMAIDEDGKKRFLRCDEDGFLICRVMSTEKSDVEED